MKINIIDIVGEHFKTLNDFEVCDDIALNDKRKIKISREDFLIFIVFPILISLVLVVFMPKLDIQVHSLSVSIFAIFSALLLNVQIALFSIYHRNWRRSNDANLQKMQIRKMDERRDLLKELNTNISYSIILSCFAVTYFFILYIFKLNSHIWNFFCYLIFFHFFLTLLMVIKRAHALFNQEYNHDNLG